MNILRDFSSIFFSLKTKKCFRSAFYVSDVINDNIIYLHALGDKENKCKRGMVDITAV